MGRDMVMGESVCERGRDCGFEWFGKGKEKGRVRRELGIFWGLRNLVHGYRPSLGVAGCGIFRNRRGRGVCCAWWMERTPGLLASP